eukprot:5453823-Amphidinium_carterae.1
MSVVDSEATKEVMLLSGGWQSQAAAMESRTKLVSLAEGLVIDSWISKSSVIFFESLLVSASRWCCTNT